MKLHLPHGLRKALLACLAAVASHHRLPRTVSTGTALLGIFSLLWGGTLRADESLPPEDDILVDEEELPPAVNEIAALEEEGGVLPIAATDKSTVDKNADHKALTTDEVTYSGDIYTWDVTQHTSFHGTGGGGTFTPWVANADGTGMEDGTSTTSGTDGFWKHFATCDKNGDTITYDTLRLTGADAPVTLDTYGLSSDPGSRFGFGGLIVEAGNGSYTVDVGYSADSPMALYWGAGTGTTTFEALILSDITFTNIRNAARAGNDGEVYGLHIISDANVRIAKGKKLTVDSVMQIDGGKTLTLSAVGDAGEAGFVVNSIDTTAAGDASPSVTLGNGVHMTVNGSITGSLNMTVGEGSTLTLGSHNISYHLKKLTLAGGSLILAEYTNNMYGFLDFEEIELRAETESTWDGGMYVTPLALAHKLTGSGKLTLGYDAGLAFASGVDVTEFTGEILVNEASYGKIELQEGAQVKFEQGGKLKIQNSSKVTLHANSSLVVSDQFNLVQGTGGGGRGEIILETGATLELKDVTPGDDNGKASRLGGSGGTLKLNNSSLTVNTNVGDDASTPGSLGGIEFTDESSSFTLSAGDLSVGKLTGAGNVTLTSGTLTLADTEGQSSYTGTIAAAGFVYAAAGREFTLTKGFGGANVGVTGGKLVVTGNFGKTGETNTWTLSGNSQLDLSGANLNLSSEQLNLVVDVSIANTLGGALKLSDNEWTTLQSLATNRKLTLTLTGLADTYQLLDVTNLSPVSEQDLQTFLEEILQWDNPHSEVSINASGLLTISPGAALTWNNEEATGTWKVGGDETPWKLGEQASGFYSNDSVIFDDASETEHTVTISGAVDAADVTVRDGTWHFTASAESDTLTVAGSITIGKAAGDDPSADPAKDASVYFDSAGNISAEAITVAGGSVLQFAGTGGLSVTGDLVIESGSRVIISGGTDEPKLKGSMTFGGIEVQGNAEFVVDGSMYSYTDAAETNHFTITNGVHGEGSLVLEDVAASWDTSNGSARPITGTHLLKMLVENSAGVGSLVLRGTSTLCIYSVTAESIETDLLKFKHFVIESGSQLWLGHASANECFQDGATIELVGSGDEDPSTESLYFSAKGTTITTTINLSGTGAVRVGLNAESTLSGTLNLNGLTLQKTGSGRLDFAGTVNVIGGGLIDVKEGSMWLQDNVNFSEIGVSLTKSSTSPTSITIATNNNGNVTIGYLAGDGGLVQNHTETGNNHGILTLDVSEDNSGKASSGAKFTSSYDRDTSTVYIHLKKQGDGTQTFTATDFGHLESIEVTAGGLVFEGSGAVTGAVTVQHGGTLTVRGNLAAGKLGMDTYGNGHTGGANVTMDGVLSISGDVDMYGDANNAQKLTLTGENESTITGTLFMTSNSEVVLQDAGTVLNVGNFQFYTNQRAKGGKVSGAGTLVVNGIDATGDHYQYYGEVASNLKFNNTENAGHDYYLAKFTGAKLEVTAGILKIGIAGLSSGLGGTAEDGSATTEVTLANGVTLEVGTGGENHIKSLAAASEVGESSILKVDAGDTLTVDTASGNYQLTVEGTLKFGGEMALSKQLVIGANGVIGAATDSGATLKVTLGKDEAASAGGAIAWGNNGATWDSKLKIDLSGVGLGTFTQWDYDNWGYQLFGSLEGLGDSFASFKDSVVEALGELAVKHMHYVLDQTGMLKVALDENVELVWTGEDGTWKNGEEAGDGWENDDDFVNGFGARFKNENGGTVALSGAVEAKNVTIETGDWTWAGTTSDTLTVNGKLTVAEGTSLAVDGDGDNKAKITLNGDVSVESGATLTVKVHGTGTEGMFARGDNSNLDVQGTLVLRYGSTTNGFARMNGFLTSTQGTTFINRLSLTNGTRKAISVNLGSDLSSILANVRTLSVEKSVTLVCFKYASLELAEGERANHTLELQEGSALGINTDDGSPQTENVTIDWQIRLAGESTLKTSSAADAILNGTLTLDGHTLTVNGNGIAELGEKFALAEGTTGGTISVTGGAMLRNTQAGLDLGKVGVNLNGGELEVAADLTLSSLDGSAGNKITGAGTLTLKDTEGTFGGTVSSNLVYDAANGTFRIGTFSGSTLKAKNGTLTVETLSSGDVTVETGGGVTVTTALTDGYAGTVTLNGGTFAASGTAKNVVVGDAGGTLDGVGGGLTATLSGSGILTAQGTLTLTGTVGGLSGNGTVNNSTLTVTGTGGSHSGTVSGLTITVGDGSTAADQAFTGGGVGINSAEVKEQGKLSLGGGTVGSLSGAGTLEVTGNVTLSGAGNSIGTLAAASGGALTVNGKLAVTGGWTGTLTKLTLGDGATLDLCGVNTEVGIGTLAGENASATIVIGDVSTKTAGTDGLQLKLSVLEGFDETHQLTLDVNALSLKNVTPAEGGYGHWEYQLFGDGWKEDWLKFIKLDTSGLGLDGKHVVRLTGDGVLQYIEMPGLVWSGQSGDGGVWAVDGNDTSDWLGDGYFENGDDVGFTEEGIEVPGVKVSGALEVGNMVVMTGGYSFTVNGGEQGSLSVRSLKLLADAGSSTSFGVDTTVTMLTGAGDLVLTGKMHVDDILRTEGDSKYTGAITLQQGGVFEASGTTKEVKAEGGTLTGTGNGLTTRLSGDGSLTAQGKLTLSGTMGGVLTAGGTSPSLTVSGALSVGGVNGSGKVNGGSLTVTGTGGNYRGTLELEGLTMRGSGSQTFSGGATVSGALSVSNGELELSGGVTVGGDVSVNGSKLTLGGKTNLKKGAEVSGGGTLTLQSGDTVLGAGAKLKAGEGSRIVLDFGGETWNHSENGNIDIELTGGTLDMNRLTGSANGQEIHLERLGGTGGSLVWHSGLTGDNRQTVHVGELSLAGGTLDLGTVAAGQELHLEQLTDVNGELTGKEDGGKVYLGNVTQAAGTSGSIQVEGGVHVHSHGGASDGFRKQGEGSFTVKSKLLVDNGSLYVNYDGTLKWGADGSIDSSVQALSGNEISVASGVTLKYTAQTKLLLLGVELFDGFTEGSVLNLDLTQTDFSRLSGGFDLGIVSTENNADLLTQLTGVIDLDDIEFGRGEDGTAGYFELSWHEEANGTYHLYLNIVGEFTISEPEWDVAWGDGLIGAPSNSEMDGHKWGGGTDVFHTAEGTGGEFTAHALELGKENSGYTDGRQTLIRLTQGAAKATETTTAAVVGGIIVDGADDPKSLYYDSYIEYKAEGEQDHVHLLVGGSCCVDATGGGGAYASFEGTSHIQLENGTVDYIVGGNHVNNSTFTFKGDSYISVFGGQVLGGVVGGSTLTKGTSSDNLYAFNGDTHIFIYKALGGAREDAPAISDGTGGGAAFAAVVGGNAWVDFGTTEGQKTMKPQYFGHTHITIDLVNPVYKGKNVAENEVQIAGRDTGVFEKSIVGGNYTAALEAPSDATERNTVFRGDTHITIAAKDATWERAEDGTLSLTGGHVFTKGVAGASRRASSGGGMTEFTGDTHIDVTGGMYREAIVGGMWFEESAVGDHAMSFTGNTEVTLHSGQFWRVVGGSYSLGGGSKASETTKGDTSVTIGGGTFDSSYGSNGEGQADIGIVVGGDFYRHDGGDSNVRTGNTRLSITGGNFRDVHIVGGDYANFSGNVGNASITGTSRVEIGGGNITGVVVGGSYLTDEGAGGQLSVGSVELTVRGGNITHEGSDAHAHHALAVVGGNMLIDNGGAHGGHNLLVGTGQELGSVNLTVTGGTIVGNVVGGSYTSDHAHGGDADNDGGNNVLAAGNITIDLSGGSIEGSVYGGHYSEVRDHSDVLVLGDITLNVDAQEGEGVRIGGDLVGGSYRAAKSGLTETDIPAEWGAQDKGNIVLNLKRGTLTGNVWGAGYHAAAEAGVNPLTSVTESVTVNLGAGFTFNGTEQVLSGGYYKGSNAEHDQSSVNNAVLNLTDGEGYNLSGVTVRDFDMVNTGADVTVKELVLTEDTAASFTKSGAGVLTVQGNLTVAQGAYGGIIHVSGGRLVVGGEVRLGNGDGGGLDFTLSAGVGTNAAGAYLAGGDIVLQRPEGGVLGLSARFDRVPTEDYAGRYYLATGLRGIEGTDVADWFETEWVGKLAELLNNDRKSYTGQLEFVGESLVLYLVSRDTHTWYWDGTGADGGMTWRGSDPGNWQLGHVDAPAGSKPDEAPEVHFTHDGEGNVRVEGTVTPGGVVVESGEYTFSGDDKSEILLSEQKEPTENGGKVVVEEGASLDLRVKTRNVKDFVVNGRLVFSAEGAVQPDTRVTLSETGTLGFGEDENSIETENGHGKLVSLNLRDDQVQGEGIVNVQVGKTWKEYQDYVTALGQETQKYEGPTEEQGKVLGSGLTSRALASGIHKTGRFALTLAWNGGTAEQSASPYGVNTAAAGAMVLNAPIVAEEGSLIYDVSGDAGTVTVFGEQVKAQVYQGAELVFRQTAGSLELSGTFETLEPQSNGELQGLLGDKYAARTVLGSVSDSAEYRLSGDFSGYTGVLEVVGNGTTSVVRVKEAKAIGAAETAEAAHVVLGLSGRAVVFEGAVGELYVAGVEVRGQNLLGGYGRTGEDDSNAAISLHGKVTGDGVLANAKGTDAEQTAYHHTLTGDLSDFTGRISAGMETGDGTGVSDSSWTLNPAATGKAYSFGLSGTGKVIVNAGGDITLSGVVGGDGDTVSLENAGKGSIILAGKNTSVGALVTGDGSFVLDGEGAEWAGNTLRGNGTLTLKRGALTHGGGMSDVRSRGLVVDATGVVNVNGTQSDKLGNIIVHGGGRLENVGGDIGTSDRLVRLEFGAGDLGDGDDGLISFAGTPGTLVVTQGDQEHTTQGEPQHGLVLDFTAEGFVDLLKKHAVANPETELRVVGNGALDLTGLEGGGDLLRVLTAGGGYGGLLSSLGFTLNADKASEGILALRGQSDRVYLVLEEGETGGNPGEVHVGTDSGALERAGAVVVDQNSELSLHFTSGSGDNDAVLHNLVGLENSLLTVSDERTDEEKAAGDAWVKLDNQMREDLGGSELGDVSDGDHTVNTDQGDGFDVRGVDTIFEGTVKSADETVNIEKSGGGELTLGSAVSGKGGLDMKGELRLSGGGITLQGNATGGGNAAGTLAFAYVGESGDSTGLRLKNGADMTVHDIAEAGEKADGTVQGGEVTLGKDSVFTFDNSGKTDESGAHTGTTLHDTVFKAERDAEGKPAEGAKLVVTGTSTLGAEYHSQLGFDGAGAGVDGADLEVTQGAEVSVQNGAVVKGGDITLTGDGSTLKVGEGCRFETDGKVTVESGSMLDLGNSTGNRAGTFCGSGTLSGNEGATLTVTGPEAGMFTGTLAGQGGTLTVGTGGSLTLDNVDTRATWNLGIGKGGNLGLVADKKGMTFGDIELAGGGSLALGDITAGLSGNLQVDGTPGLKGKLSVDVGDGKERVRLGELRLQDKEGKGLTEGNAGDFLDVTFTGRGASHFDAYLQQDRDGTWFVGLQRVHVNPYVTPGMHGNVRAGANLMWDADDLHSVAGAYVYGEGASGDLAKLNRAVAQHYNEPDLESLLTGTYNPMVEAERTFAAVAGSSTSVLAVAGLQEVKRQLETMRNRSATLGDATVNADPGARMYSFWMNAETGYHKADADGWAPGYTLDGWGGSIGECTGFAHGITAGLALTAMYNDLKTDSADCGTGDFDVAYLSGYVRMQRRTWSHTLVAVYGEANITLNRTVNYAAGASYRAHGETDGYMMGIMYEVTRSTVLNEKGTLVLQPVFNVQLRHAEADGYNETGSDAGLHVDDIEATVVTFGLGARLQTRISENAFGRSSVLETRLLAKADAGDSEGKTENRLLHGTMTQEVESADTGKYGIEVGVGLTVPVGSRGGTFFLDGSMELRENYQEYNAGVGYRINF